MPDTARRVPPHDLDAETALLGACLLTRDARTITHELGVTPTDFYKPNHQAIYQAIVTLTTADQPVDPVTVAAELRHTGHLDHIGSRAQLLELQADTPASANAAHYARIIRSHSRARQLLELADDLTTAIYDGHPTDTIADQIARTTDLAELEAATSWALIDLLPVVTGQIEPITPTILTRTDGQPLLYPGLIHAFNAEPEAGKSMLSTHACAQTIADHHHVAYLDFEDSVASVVGRLLAMGSDPDDILEYFHYARIDDPIDHQARQLITTLTTTWPLQLAILDGVAEAMAMSGWEENSNHDVALFYTALPRQLSRTGTTVVLIDHLVKDKDSQGRYGRGAGAKLAGIDGATYKLENVHPFGRGLDGMTKITIQKDRPGWLRHLGKTVAEMHVHSPEDGDHIHIELRPSSTPAKTSDEPFRPTFLMEQVSRFLEAAPDELTGRQVSSSIPAKRRQHVLDALQVLVDEKYVERRAGPNRSQLHHSVKPYRQEQPTPPQPLHHDPDQAPHDPTEEPPPDLWEHHDDDRY